MLLKICQTHELYAHIIAPELAEGGYCAGGHLDLMFVRPSDGFDPKVTQTKTHEQLKRFRGSKK